MKKTSPTLKTPSFHVVSLFSGGMGLDIGLKAASLNVMVSQDIDNMVCRNS